MKKNGLLIISFIMIAVLLMGCGASVDKQEKPTSPTKVETNEDFIKKMLTTAHKKYPHALIDYIGVQDGASGNWRGQINLVDYDELTPVIIYFPHSGNQIRKKTNPWNQSESELAEEIAELKQLHQQNGLSQEGIEPTDYYRKEIQKVMTLNQLDPDKPLEIDFGYSLTETGVSLQCDFQTKIDKKSHTFVMMFDERELTRVICQTLKLAPIEGVEVLDESSQ